MGLAAGLVLEAAVVTWSHDWPGPASPHQPPATQPMAAEQQEQEGWWRVASWSRTLPPAAGARVVTGVARAGQDSVWRLVVARLPRWQTGGHERWRPGPGCLMTHSGSGSSGHGRGSVASGPVASADIRRCDTFCFQTTARPSSPEPWSPSSARGDVLRSASHRSLEPCCSHQSRGYP